MKYLKKCQGLCIYVLRVRMWEEIRNYLCFCFWKSSTFRYKLVELRWQNVIHCVCACIRLIGLSGDVRVYVSSAHAIRAINPCLFLFNFCFVRVYDFVFQTKLF